MRLSQNKYLLILILLIFSQQAYTQSAYKVKTIVIDAGHGGRKPGARGAISYEKNVALEVALKLGKKLEQDMPEVKILYTRKTDVDVDFYKRAAIANDAKADIFISIHCNSMPKGNHVTKGTETFVAGMHRINEQDVAIRENADIVLEKNYQKNYGGFDPKDPETFIVLSLFKNKFRGKSMELAGLIQKNYTEVDGRVNRGIKEQGILILQRVGMPAVLTEIGFISNPEEERYMNSDKGQQEIVNSIFNAIKIYKKENDTH